MQSETLLRDTSPEAGALRAEADAPVSWNVKIPHIFRPNAPRFARGDGPIYIFGSPDLATMRVPSRQPGERRHGAIDNQRCHS